MPCHDEPGSKPERKCHNDSNCDTECDAHCDNPAAVALRNPDCKCYTNLDYLGNTKCYCHTYVHPDWDLTGRGNVQAD
jgi:hypothetical protein